MLQARPVVDIHEERPRSLLVRLVAAQAPARSAAYFHAWRFPARTGVFRLAAANQCTQFQGGV